MENGPSTWSPGTQVEDANGVADSCLQTALTLAIADIWQVNQWMGGVYLAQPPLCHSIK